MDNFITTTELSEECGYAASTVIKKLESNGFVAEQVYIDHHICKAWTNEAREWLKKTAEEENNKLIPVVEYAKEMNVPMDLFRQAMANLGLFSAYKTTRNKRLEEEVRKLVEKDKEALYESHPLVKDKRCFTMSYWPNIIPNCFGDLDEDIV